MCSAVPVTFHVKLMNSQNHFVARVKIQLKYFNKDIVALHLFLCPRPVFNFTLSRKRNSKSHLTLRHFSSCQQLKFSTVLTEMSFVFASLPTSLQVCPPPISYLADLTFPAKARTQIVPSIIPKYNREKHQ